MTSKFHKAGHEISMMLIERAILVEDASTWAHQHFHGFDPDVKAEPNARYV